MRVPSIPTPQISPYAKQYNEFKTANNNILIRSVIRDISTAASPAPHAFGSDAAQMDSLSRMIATLKGAYDSGLYGYERGFAGSHIDKKA